MTARIHWARIAWTLAAVGSFGAAEAQVSICPSEDVPVRVVTGSVRSAGVLPGIPEPSVAERPPVVAGGADRQSQQIRNGE